MKLGLPLSRGGLAFGLLQSETSGVRARAALQPQPGPPLHRQFQLFVGQQININPWFLQPIVITGQFNWIAKNDGKPDFCSPWADKSR